MSIEIPEIEPPKPRKFLKMPDVGQKNKQINELNTKITKIESSIAIVSTELDKTVTPKDDLEKRNQLTSELKSIISSQNDVKNKRHNLNDQVKILDQNIKKKINEISSKISKYNFNNIESIDKKIKEIESKVEAGNMMLAEEKRAMKEISSLNKLKKDFSGIEETQKSIDSDKAKIADLKQSINSLTNKEVQSKFETITKELDSLNEKNKGVQTKRDELFKKRRSLNDEKFEILKEIRKIRSDFDAKFKKFKTDMDNERKKREEEEKAYTLYLEKKDLAKEIKDIEESSNGSPFAPEISNIKSAIIALDPSVKFDDEENVEDDKISSKSDKTEIDAELNDDDIIKKENVCFFEGTKKEKKYKKKNQNKNAINSVITTKLTMAGVRIPANKDAIPETVKELQSKLEALKIQEVDAQKKLKEEADSKIASIKEKMEALDKQIIDELEKKKERESKPVEEEEEKEEKSEEKPEESA